jgi:hypothetical protein
VARLHVAQLQVALRLYQAKTGKPAEELALLKDYLAEVPTDPFDGRPFRYRLSKGEKIVWPEDNPENVPPGAAGGGMGPGPMPPGGAPAMPGMGGPVMGGLPGGAPALPGPPGGAGPAPPAPAVGGAGGMMGAGGPGGQAMPPPEEWRPPVKQVPAGQGILWSVGEDRQDDGGVRQPGVGGPPGGMGGFDARQAPAVPGEDLIYLVPLPPSKQPAPKKPARR